MKSNSLLVILIVTMIFASCNQQTAKKENTVKGNWAFLDKFGNYNEAWFGDSLYATYNKFMKRSPDFLYEVKNDSLYSTVDKRKKGMSPIAKITWLGNDRIVLNTEFVRDTLYPIDNDATTLGNSDPVKDSVLYRKAFEHRYEEFLIAKKIISREEIEHFHKSKKIPKDVKEQLAPDSTK